MKKLVVMIGGLAIIAGMAGYFLFQDITLERQERLLNTLVDVAAIVFAILGAWTAILDPTAVLISNPTDTPSPRSQLAMQLAPLLVAATIDLAAVLFLLLAGSTVPAHISNAPWYKATHGATLTFLCLFEILILINTLLPIISVWRKRYEDELRRRYRQ